MIPDHRVLDEIEATARDVEHEILALEDSAATGVIASAQRRASLAVLRRWQESLARLGRLARETQ